MVVTRIGLWAVAPPPIRVRLHDLAISCFTPSRIRLFLSVRVFYSRIFYFFGQTFGYLCRLVSVTTMTSADFQEYRCRHSGISPGKSIFLPHLLCTVRKICIFEVFQQLTTSVRCMMLMQGTHMPLNRNNEADYLYYIFSLCCV